MLNINSQPPQDFSTNDSKKVAYQTIRLSDTHSKSLSPSIISDTSPVYLFCTSKNSINSKNENGWTPIYRSIIANNLIALSELLKLGSDPDIGNNLGETPLYLCVDVDNYDALIILLQYNANTNIAKRNGTTPLHIAAKKNKDNYISALLRNNANPNLQNKLYSQTPMHIAIINKVSEEMLNLFKEHNADIYGIKDKYDKTPFDYAKELKDDEYVNLLMKIFGENKESNDKKNKTFNVNKIPDEISKKNDKINNINIKNNFHNSGFNIFPEKLNNIYSGEDLKKGDFKLETNNENSDNKSPKSKKLGILSSGDALYSDRSVSDNGNNIDNNNNENNNIQKEYNLSEFNPETKPVENNNNNSEIKSKNSLTKIVKNNINIDTKMIDNLKDIIVLNNENSINSKKINENEIINNDLINNKENININININEMKNEQNIQNEENKILNSNNDRELIKNIISSTVKKIKVNTNTFNSEFSSLNNNSDNNNSITQNNPSSKNDYVKMINFSSISNNKESSQKNNQTNLDNLIKIDNQKDNGTSSFILYNNKKQENEIEIKNIENTIYGMNQKETKNQTFINDGLNEITPISNSKTNNIHSNSNNSNTNIFSETTQINALINLPNNNITQNEEEISNTNMNNINEISDKENKELNTNLDIDKETEKKESQKISIEYDNDNNNFYDASLEYSKSKSYLGNDIINNNSPNPNNINNNNYNILNQHHRQISYHNNSKSINKRKKEDSNSNNKLSKNDLENLTDKENDNPNNNEIIYYNKNYLAGNNTPKPNQNDIFINQKNTVIKKNLNKARAHSDINVNDISNIHRYNSLTDKTNTINQKIFTYTSPNFNKNTYLINTKINLENNNEENNNNVILHTNPNINISNLNETKDDFFSGNNNNLSSFLNTNKQNMIIRESKNNNSTFNVYDEVNEAKNLGRKTDSIATNFHTLNNNKNENKFKNNNEKNVKNNFRGSSMGNTTLSSAAKNILGTGKKSINSVMNTGRNSNANLSNNIIKNIPVNMLLRLRDWLISCDLLCYYNLLIENNMYDIDQMINDMKSNNTCYGYKEIEDIGIRKPGHIFRLLLKLEIDSGILDNNIFNSILSKFNITCSISNNVILTSSMCDIKCCGICNKNNNYNSFMRRTNWPYNDIFSFLKFKDLWKFKENFLHNGFDQLEYILLQLFSKYKFNKNILNDCLHIYTEKDKIFVLNKLYEEKTSFAKECGIECEENDFEKDGNNQILYNFSYSSSSKKKNFYTNEQTQKDGDFKFCNIF